MSYELLFLRALALTVAVETAALFALRPWLLRGGDAGSPFRLMAAGLICSAATLPYLWFVLPAWIKGYYPLMAAGEIGVTAAEAGLLAALLRIGAGRASALSLLCNLASFLAGLVFLR